MKLSNRPDKIARQLQVLGFTGYRKSLACPLSEYWEAESGMYANVLGNGLLQFCPRGEEGAFSDRPLTAGEAEFVRRFDSGGYPYLERR